MMMAGFGISCSFAFIYIVDVLRNDDLIRSYWPHQWDIEVYPDTLPLSTSSPLPVHFGKAWAQAFDLSFVRCPTVVEEFHPQIRWEWYTDWWTVGALFQWFQDLQRSFWSAQVVGLTIGALFQLFQDLQKKFLKCTGGWAKRRGMILSLSCWLG